MKVREITQLQPLSSVYELKQDNKYIILVPATELSQQATYASLRAMKKAGIDAVLILARDTTDFRIFDVESLL